MIYTSYTQVIRDINYAEEFDLESRPRHRYEYERSDMPDYRLVQKLKRVWLDHVRDGYQVASKGTSALARFLKQYPLPFKEFCCLVDLMEYTNSKSDFEVENRVMEGELFEPKDILGKHKVRYESSCLRRYKLVYRLINPLRPLKVIYEPSFKAQLGLKGQKYTDEYEQLDLELEDESKRNSPDAMDSLYYVIEPKEGFQDLVASKDTIDSLRSALSRELEKDKIFKTWGFGKVISYGKGTTLNFRGPPGTGKTLAAHCLAKELSRKLLMVRYDQLQDMYLGQTEKHIQQVFQLAKRKNAVLFFDEADAVALTRVSLEKSWEMSQVNTLMKELERFEGVCIFATNYADRYDPAFERRLTMHISFEMPTKEQAASIFEKVLPKQSRDSSVSLKQFDLTGFSGGDIKNIALNAAGIAARKKSDKIRQEHISQAIRLVKSARITEKKDTRYIA